MWVEVDTLDGTVVSYQRDDLYQTYLNDPADPAPYAGMADRAAPLLKGTLELRLEYVPLEGDPGRAVLRYVPEYGDDYYVDAATGELVNLFCSAWGEGLTWENHAEKNAPHEANFLKLDCSKIKGTLGWSPRWHISDAIAKTVEWTKVWQSGGSVPAVMDKQIQEYLGGHRA